MKPITVSERDYILLNDLTRLRSIQESMRDIVAESNELIDNTQYTLMYSTIRVWIKHHFDALDVQTKPTDVACPSGA